MQLLLVGTEILMSLLFVLSFWWVSKRLRYLWQGFWCLRGPTLGLIPISAD
jgi:hypothetical protein